jgi:hypothetical protein
LLQQFLVAGRSAAILKPLDGFIHLGRCVRGKVGVVDNQPPSIKVIFDYVQPVLRTPLARNSHAFRINRIRELP